MSAARASPLLGAAVSDADSCEVEALTGISPILTSGAWMTKSKAVAKGEVDASSSKILGGSWKKKFVWVDASNFSYGVDEFVVEKQYALHQCRAAEILLPEQAAKLGAPQQSIDCCWVLRTVDKATAFAADSETQRAAWVEAINNILPSRKMLLGGDGGTQQPDALLRSSSNVNRSASPDGVSPIRDHDPLQPDANNKHSENSSIAYPNNSSFASHDDVFDGRLSRRSSAASEGARPSEQHRASPIPSVHVGAFKAPPRTLSSAGSFRRIPISNSVNNNSIFLPDTPNEHQPLQRTPSNLSYLNNRSFAGGVVSTPRDSLSSTATHRLDPEPSTPQPPPANPPVKFGMEDYKPEVYNLALDDCVSGKWIQKGKSGRIKGSAADTPAELGGGGWHQRFLWLEDRKLYYGKDKGERETEFFVDEIVKVYPFRPDEMAALKAPEGYLQTGWCILTKQGRLVNIASESVDDVKSWCLILNYLRPETSAEVGARGQYEQQKAIYEEYVEKQRKEREAKLAAEAEAKRKKEAELQLRKAMMAVLAAEKAKQAEERERAKKAEEERKAEEETFRRLREKAENPPPAEEATSKPTTTTNTEAKSEERSCCVIA